MNIKPKEMFNRGVEDREAEKGRISEDCIRMGSPLDSRGHNGSSNSSGSQIFFYQALG